MSNEQENINKKMDMLRELKERVRFVTDHPIRSKGQENNIPVWNSEIAKLLNEIVELQKTTP